jgi:hypothetical protein
MDRPRLTRGLRIAWSAWWGILCVLLVVLWVRSYSWKDLLSGHVGNRWFVIESAEGRLAFRSQDNAGGISTTWRIDSWGTRTQRYGTRINDDLIFRHWSLAFTFAILASLPCMVRFPSRLRFRLRTLLIATTLIAVVLGLIVWSRS